MKEYLLKTDDYVNPMIIKDRNALSILLLRLLIMEPGTHPAHPEMGVGVISRWRYSSIEDKEQIEKEIRDQITMYLPEYQSAEVAVQIQGDVLRLSIVIDGTIFNYSTDAESDNDELISLIEDESLETE